MSHPSTPDPTPSTASKVLANAKCRTVVQYLIAKEMDTTDFDELVDFVHEEIDTITMVQIRLSYQIENPRSENLFVTLDESFPVLTVTDRVFVP